MLSWPPSCTPASTPPPAPAPPASGRVSSNSWLSLAVSKPSTTSNLGAVCGGAVWARVQRLDNPARAHLTCSSIPAIQVPQQCECLSRQPNPSSPRYLAAPSNHTTPTPPSPPSLSPPTPPPHHPHPHQHPHTSAWGSGRARPSPAAARCPPPPQPPHGTPAWLWSDPHGTPPGQGAACTHGHIQPHMLHMLCGCIVRPRQKAVMPWAWVMGSNGSYAVCAFMAGRPAAAASIPALAHPLPSPSPQGKCLWGACCAPQPPDTPALLHTPPRASTPAAQAGCGSNNDTGMGVTRAQSQRRRSNRDELVHIPRLPFDPLFNPLTNLVTHSPP